MYVLQEDGDIKKMGLSDDWIFRTRFLKWIFGTLRNNTFYEFMQIDASLSICEVSIKLHLCVNKQIFSTLQNEPFYIYF